MRMYKKEMIAMILAGGQGSRLKDLTHKIAKPAVPFGGKYRIIDFALSNCANSEIDTVGVLTQYEPYVLSTHIGIGSPWDLDRRHGGVRVLPPYYNQLGGRWYKGTANAIYENLSFIERYDPEYVLILSGDHIYNMDYSKMLQYHKKKKAEVTIAVKGVTMEEATRFGILSADESGRIYDFEEKPAHPKSTNASMGIYIFNWSLLKEALTDDEANLESKNDFGKNIIPKLLSDNADIFAYEFEGYWRDVGTVESLWEANMDLLNRNSDLDLFNKAWRVYSANTISPPQFIAPTANVENSLINDGCIIEGNVKKSIISTKVKIGKNSTITESVIMPDAIIEENVVLHKTIVMSGAVVKDNTIVEGSDDNVIIVTGKEA
ncbi:glucose-1-phosphate adenylyltransferase [Acidaminobacter sp. JC074]|uniref:glucose-1-phosphate adenylyltransferase n=1 Tax=Acidaminobacter sp. JC074 TaxID=2530199 RepID=UPI002ED404F6